MQLIENWHKDLLKFWSVRVVLFWALLSSIYVAWPAFADKVPAPWYAGISVAMGFAVTAARALKQPGLSPRAQ